MTKSRIYEVKSLSTDIRKTPSINSDILGTLTQNTQIEIINFFGSWAYFKYNKQDAYILTSDIKKVSSSIPNGSVTINYIDSDSNEYILPSKIYDNLSIGTYAYLSEDIYGYNIDNDVLQAITISNNDLNKTINFKYNKISCNIIIKYLDIDSSIYIKEDKIISDLDLGTYTFEADEIDNFNCVDHTNNLITLTQDNPNQTIIFKYTKILGSITIKYIDSDSKLDIHEPIVYSNLELNQYSYNSITIDGYNLTNNSSQTITLTQDNTNQTIVFEYIKILGSITIRYIDFDSKLDIHKPVVYSNLELEKYSYSSIDIDEYNLTNHNLQTIILTQDNPNQTIVFEYKKIEDNVPVLDPKKQNEVPYISTYYIKPIVKPNEEVIINYYITDFYRKEYVNEDFSEKFKVTVKIEGKNNIVINNLLAGDHSVSLGKFTNIGEQNFSILCTDKYGRNSHELFNFFLIKEDIKVNEYIMTKKDLIDYNISNKDNITMITSTREGLQKLLSDKKSQGFNQLKLLTGTYRIDHKGTIYIPTEFTLDMNNSTLKLHEFAGDKALMIELNNTFDSHVINGTIEGDYYNHDYANSPNNSEWVNGISIGGESKYSSFENLIIKDITGYGSGNGIANSKVNSLGYTYINPRGIGDNFKLGDIDRNTGLDIESTNRTTCDFRDISGYSDIGYLSISIYLGYQGNPCSTWNLICHFYDENKKFIKSIDAYQYRRVAVPTNAQFMRVTILNESYPTNLSIQLFRIPTHCSFKNILHENCRCVGMAQAAMNNMLVENCEFTNCGQSSAKCAYDAEDGWDMMQDVTFKGLNFHDNPNNEFLTCAGHNFIVENQVDGDIYIWERTKDFVLRNSNVKNINLGYNESIIRHGIYRIYNNTIISGNINKNIGRNLNIINSLGGILYNSNLSALYSGSIYTDCTINISSEFLGYLSQIKMDNCNFIPTDDFDFNYRLSFNGGHSSSYVFSNCKFYGSSTLSNNNNFYSGIFENCYFENTSIDPNVSADETDEIKFINCDINYSSKYLIRYSPFNYTKGNYTKVTFDNCNISSTKDGTNFVYAYAKPYKGYLELNNCILDLPNLTTFLDCYNGYLENIEDFYIIIKNTSLNKNITMLSTPIKNNKNITIDIS